MVTSLAARRPPVIVEDSTHAPATDDSTAPPLFKALEEQLGLHLESAKEPVQTLVVDHVEMPTEN